MTASQAKYYFRKKEATNSSGNDSFSSSAESDDFTARFQDARQVTLHVITDPGQSATVKSSFQHLVKGLDPSLDVICFSERFRPLKIDKTKNDTGTSKVPALAVLLFFKDEYKLDTVGVFENSQSEEDVNKDEHGSIRENESNLTFQNVTRIFSQKPWRFHHKVTVSGKLISCDTNQQDYYEYNLNSKANSQPHDRKTLTLGLQTLFSSCSHFPLWGARKVHYGKKIMRFTLFVSQEKWEDQISLYKLVLRREEVKIRDDFCYFETFSNKNTIVQMGLKKLPLNLKPQPLSSSILQFKVKNVGQLVPLLPNACEPISELRWRTRDHDLNVILFQIYRANIKTPIGASFVKKVFSDPDSSYNKGKEYKTTKQTSLSSDEKKSSCTTTEKSRRTLVRKSHKVKLKDKCELKTDLLNFSNDSNSLGDSFICPSLPEKMPLLEPILYFQPTGYFSSSSSTASSSGHRFTEAKSLDVNNRTLKPYRSATPNFTFKLNRPTTDNSGRLSVPPNAFSSENQTVFKSSSQEGFYV